MAVPSETMAPALAKLEREIREKEDEINKLDVKISEAGRLRAVDFQASLERRAERLKSNLLSLRLKRKRMDDKLLREQRK